MVIYYIEFKGFDDIITIVYDTKRHRYTISLFGEKELDFSKKQGEAIIKFLRFIKEKNPDFIEMDEEYEFY